MAELGDVVWCHCHSMTRDGGMCSEGFCNPEHLDPDSEQDLPLIAEHWGVSTDTIKEGWD